MVNAEEEGKMPTVNRRALLGCALAGLSAVTGCAGDDKPKTGPTLKDIALGRGPQVSDSTLARADATAMAAMIRAKELSPYEAVEAALRRAALWNPSLNAIVNFGVDSALAAAKNVDLSSMFSGVPVVISDLSPWRGLGYSQGSAAYKDTIAETEPAYVGAWRQQAGVVAIGKGNCAEFGFSPSTEPSLFGPCRNPWNVQYSAGGASGGAAAAVAAGIVPLALASDAGGSLRLPAAACGLFGLKPSRGRMIDDADVPPNDALTVCHAISRSVRDSAALLAATERSDTAAPMPPVGLVRGPGRRRLNIFVHLPGLQGRLPDSGVQNAVKQAGTLCQNLGHRVEFSPDAWLGSMDGPALVEAFFVMKCLRAGQIVARLEAERETEGKALGLEPFTLYLADHGRGLTDTAINDAIGVLEAGRIAYESALKAADAVITPVFASSNVLIGEFGPQVPTDVLRGKIMSYLSYTPLQNIAGVPAMSVPLGVSGHGLPIGVQFVAQRGQERLLLELAFELEAAQPWSMPGA